MEEKVEPKVITVERIDSEVKEKYHGHPKSYTGGRRPDYGGDIRVSDVKAVLGSGDEINCEELCKKIGDFAFEKKIEISNFSRFEKD